jgi:flagellar hook-length control protein FliK
MNLSNYLQMPPAPAAPQTPQNAPAKGSAAVVGLDSAGHLKLDFAQIMARQFQQMPQLRRQDLAAASGLAKVSTRSKDLEDESSQAATAPQTRLSDRLGNTSETHAYLKDAAEKAADKAAQDDADAKERADKDAQTRQTRGAANDNADAAPQAAWLQNPLVSMAVPPTGNAATHDAAAPMGLTALPDGTPLHTVALSPQTQLITDPRHAPSPQSLLAFAQSMGMDPEAIGQLMGQADASALAANAAAGTPVANAAQQAGQLGQNVAAHPGTNPLQASLQAAMQANGLGGQSGDAAAMLTSLTATQVQAHSVGTPSQAVHLPPTPVMSTLQMLTPADPNAALNGAMQVSMLPVAPALAASGGSILDVLDMRSADLPESHISALAGLLSEASSADGSSLSQDASSNSDNPQGSFGQALAAKAGATGNEAANRGHAANGVNRPMSEVYDRLSEKLSTEMAARINEQINNGQWKMKFGLRPAHLGGVEVQLEMKDGKLNAQLQADNPMTRELLQSSSQRLRDALANLGVQTNQVTVGHNASGFAHTGSQGQGGGNQPQVGDNLASSVSPHEATPERGNAPSAKGSDSLLDLYA